MIWILLVELTAEDSIAVTWGTTTAAFKGNRELPRLLDHLLVIHPDDTVISCGHKLCTICIIVDSQKLVELVENGVEQFSRGQVPMLEGAVRINRNDDILGHSWAVQGSPLDGNHWHFLLHLTIKNKRRLTGEHVIDADGAIEGALSKILISGVESDIESLGFEVTHGPLMGNLDG